MKTQEHIVAFVEPTLDGESALKIAQETVKDGGRATVVVLVSRQTMTDVRAFAESENLTVPDATAIYFDRLGFNVCVTPRQRGRVGRRHRERLLGPTPVRCRRAGQSNDHRHAPAVGESARVAVLRRPFPRPGPDHTVRRCRAHRPGVIVDVCGAGGRGASLPRW